MTGRLLESESTGPSRSSSGPVDEDSEWRSDGAAVAVETKLKRALKRALLERLVCSGLVAAAAGAGVAVSDVRLGFLCDISSGVITRARPKSITTQTVNNSCEIKS